MEVPVVAAPEVAVAPAAVVPKAVGPAAVFAIPVREERPAVLLPDGQQQGTQEQDGQLQDPQQEQDAQLAQLQLFNPFAEAEYDVPQE